MSVQDFSALFADRIAKSIDKQLANTPELLDPKKFRQNFEAGSKGQESIITRGSLEKLKNDFLTANEEAKFYGIIDGKKDQPLDRETSKKLQAKLKTYLDKLEFDKFSDWVLTKPAFQKFVQSETYIPIQGPFSGNYKGNVEQHSSASLNRSKSYAVVRQEDLTASYKDALFLKNIGHGVLVEYLVEYLQKQLQAPAPVVDFFRNNTQSGHLTGLAAIKVANYFDVILSSDGKSLTVDEKTISSIESPKQIEQLKIVTSIVKLIADADYLTSNLTDHYELFITADKHVFSENPSVSTEAQLKALNEKAGAAMAAIGLAIGELSKKAREDPRNFRSMGQSKKEAIAEDSLIKLFQALGQVGELIVDASKSLKLDDKASADALERALTNKKVIDDFIDTKGSTPLRKSIPLSISSILKTGKLPPREDTHISLELKQKLPSINKLKKTINKLSKEAKTIDASLKSVSAKSKSTSNLQKLSVTSKLRNTQGKFTSLASLQTLLNLALHDQIQRNMGTGTSRNVLNYRTGRLAESAQVTSMSQSRESMITAFYTYQRNPYGTFSEGGAQSSPKTRDPKLLISKSIREIMSTQVNNRLRAVLA